jgi:hypothetical protein
MLHDDIKKGVQRQRNKFIVLVEFVVECVEWGICKNQ